MTPNAIEILIHCHVSQRVHPRIHAPAVLEEIDSFLLNGLIEHDPEDHDVYITTDRGKAHIEQLCRTAWPTQSWIGADGTIIEF